MGVLSLLATTAEAVSNRQKNSRRGRDPPPRKRIESFASPTSSLSPFEWIGFVHTPLVRPAHGGQSLDRAES